MSKSKIHCVVGGQFGSEAKGAVAAFLSTQIKNKVVGVRVGGPNAGHTVYGKCPADHNLCDHPVENDSTVGHPWRLRQVPVLAVSRPDADLIIAQGSEVDIEVLRSEIDALDSAGYNVSRRLIVDGMATVISNEHKLHEAQASLSDRIGSTAKGIGAARADRIMRRASVVKDHTYAAFESRDDTTIWSIPDENVADTTSLLNKVYIAGGCDVIIEGTQGYGLGLHTQYYPFTTSGDARAVDVIAQTGIASWNAEVHVWLVIRPNPIRVGGNSGPLYGETTWEALGLPSEQTTVTKKTRRVGAWDPELVNEAIHANGGPSTRLHVVLSMLDHLVPACAGKTTIEGMGGEVVGRVRLAIGNLESTIDAPVELIGTGPRTMTWYREAGLNAAQRTDPFGSIRRAAEEAIRMFANGSAPVQILDEPTQYVDELTDWWLGVAEAEVKPMVDKALEYGGKGAAIDLIDIGTDIARMNGRDPATLTVAELTELGIVFYARGKMSRIVAAVMEGRFASDDSWHDLGVYARMVQRTRQVGGWPYKSVDQAG